MYLKKEISISFFITTISASNLYMPMIWSYVFLLDFLIPFLCGPDLQCGEVQENIFLPCMPGLVSLVQENISCLARSSQSCTREYFFPALPDLVSPVQENIFLPCLV
jgi:hypothetical protein